MMTERNKERELVEIFEVAKKAAADATEDGGAEENRCLDALTQLKTFPVNVQLLVSTQVGKRLRVLTKHTSKNIQDLSADIFAQWKKLVLVQSNDDKKNVSGENTYSIKAHSHQQTLPSKVAEREGVNVEKIDRKGTPPFAKVLNSETVARSSHPARQVGSIPKCNDVLRNRIREQLYEALCKVSTECKEDIQDKVSAVDPIQVAVSVEAELYRSWGRSNGAHKIKYRSLLFNIKDARNPDFRRKILLGQLKPERIVDMSSQEMASDERQQLNETIEKKALYHCEIGGSPKATTDQFKCGRCGQHKTTYHQLQTRSADEPMTTYVTCANCNHNWKFC